MIDYQKELNKEQLQVVQNGDGPCLVLAGAGTGKTRTIVYRVAYLLEKGIRPESILLVTFTNKAAREMLERIGMLVKYTEARLLVDVAEKPSFLFHLPWSGTFHHVGNLVLRRYGPRIGLTHNFTILDQADSREVIRNIMAELALDKGDKKSFPTADLLQDLISYATNSLRGVDEIVDEWIPKQKNRLGDILRVAEKYEQKKRQSNLMDFDDLLALWLKVLRECPEIKQKLSDKFEYILIDEYQDTNRLQGSVVEELARGHKNILVVGDDAQSIYGFRAATVENIMKFPEIFSQTRIFKLKQNYRSTQSILDLANTSIARNRRQFEKKLETVRERGEKPELVCCANLEQEAEFVSRKIVELHDQGATLKEIAVLFRAAFHGMQLELKLQKLRIPYIIRGGVRFFEQAHIKDILAYFKVLSNSKDAVAWQRILKLEQGIGDKTAELIIKTLEQGNKETLSGQAQNAARKVFHRVEQLKECQGITQMARYLLKTFYTDYAENTFENAAERLEDLEQLALFAEQYDTLEEFLADATLSEGFRGERAATPGSSASTATEAELPNNDYLVLSTIHQAKGLEWENVFVIGLVDGQFPHYRSLDKSSELEEERRLFYVATTRAKKHLFLTYALTQYDTFGGALRRPSLFVRELNPDLYQTVVEDEDGEKIIDVSDWD